MSAIAVALARPEATTVERFTDAIRTRAPHPDALLDLDEQRADIARRLDLARTRGLVGLPTLSPRRPLPRNVVTLERHQTAYRNQGRGTCRAFATVAATEAAYRRDHGLTLDLTGAPDEGFLPNPSRYAARSRVRSLQFLPSASRENVMAVLDSGHEVIADIPGHCFLIIGYDFDRHEWLVKNSWGSPGPERWAMATTPLLGGTWITAVEPPNAL